MLSLHPSNSRILVHAWSTICPRLLGAMDEKCVEGLQKLQNHFESLETEPRRHLGTGFQVHTETLRFLSSREV